MLQIALQIQFFVNKASTNLRQQIPRLVNRTLPNGHRFIDSERSHLGNVISEHAQYPTYWASKEVLREGESVDIIFRQQSFMSMDSSLLTLVRAPAELADEASALSNVGNQLDGSSLQPLCQPAELYLATDVEQLNNLTYFFRKKYLKFRIIFIKIVNFRQLFGNNFKQSVKY